MFGVGFAAGIERRRDNEPGRSRGSHAGTVAGHAACPVGSAMMAQPQAEDPKQAGIMRIIYKMSKMYIY